MLSNWKTTLAAIGAAAFAVYQITQMVAGTASADDVMAAIFAAAAAFGFSFAKDATPEPPPPGPTPPEPEPAVRP